MSGWNGDVEVPENGLIGGVRKRDVAELDAAAGNAHSGGLGRIDDFVRADDAVHAVAYVADVLEELQEPAAQIARLVDEQQRRSGRDHELRYRDLPVAP